MLRSLDGACWIVNRKPVRERDYSVEFQRGGGARLPALFHNFHLVTFYITGRTVVVRRTNRGTRSATRFSAGESCIRPAGPAGTAEWHGSADCLHIHIHPRLLRCVGEEHLGDGRLAFDSLPHLRDPRVREIAMEMHESISRDVVTPQYAQQLVTGLCRHLLSEYAAREAPPIFIGRLSVEEILDALRDTSAGWNGIAGLARQAGLTRSHFSRQVRAVTGISASAFLQKSRIEAAKTLVERGQESISEVAYRLGFADQSHLTRAFRRATGMAPAQYRSIRRT